MKIIAVLHCEVQMYICNEKITSGNILATTRHLNERYKYLKIVRYLMSRDHERWTFPADGHVFGFCRKVNYLAYLFLFNRLVPLYNKKYYRFNKNIIFSLALFLFQIKSLFVSTRLQFCMHFRNQNNN